MTELQYKTLKDGSIDYGYYKQRGRSMRGEAVHAFFAGIGKFIGSLAGKLLGRAEATRSRIKAVPAAKMAAGAKPDRLFWNIG